MSGILSKKSALVLGAGGLGSPALMVLASSGVGRIAVVDGSALETSDLNRQPLFTEADLGERRGAAAARRLTRLFPAVNVEVVDGCFDEASAAGLARSADVLVDGADDAPTKFLASDAALLAGRPLVHGGVLRYTAHLLTVIPGVTGCLRCLFETPPPPGSVPGVAEAGVLGPLAGLAGALMGAEAVRLLLGERGAYAGRLLVYEARRARSRAVPVRIRDGCPACRAQREAVASAGAAAPGPGTPTAAGG
ncbi:MAG TPA: HesA/MoeB/ThiF family protein [Anaeromyxobacteraceae bacterium]|nr:HesA/MoeB/ThiF family protein [Anaeromyxobacteraceae bacterium]